MLDFKVFDTARLTALRDLIRPLYGSLVAQVLPKHVTYGARLQRLVRNSGDVVRYSAIALAAERIECERVEGNVAELGVFRGDTSAFLRRALVERRLYLFDTFQGFPAEHHDSRFANTSLELVRRKLGDCSNVIFRQGRFPDTSRGLEDETFSLVILDVDFYEPTFCGLEFFYPRVSPGGYIFVHDYNNPRETAHKAVDDFFRDKAERVIELPDHWGSCVVRKLGPRTS